jgi:hypothetical protein
VTRGRQGEYADAAIAQWIRGHLEQRGWAKQDLAAKVARRRKIKLASATKLVIRWTKDGGQPDPEGIADLTAIFGEAPPTSQTNGWLQAQLAEIQQRLSGLEDLPERTAALESALAELAQPRRGTRPRR